VFVVRLDVNGHIRVVECRKIAIGLGSDWNALDVLFGPKTNIGRRLSSAFEQLGAGMLGKHALAKCPQLFPFVTAILELALSSAQGLVYEALR
jgi:hypothetical protein